MTADVPVILLANKKHYWLLPGFFHCARTYWKHQLITVAGYETPTPKQLSKAARFVSIAPKNFPAHLWSTGFIKLLRGLASPYFILMLEDYWLIEPVKKKVVDMLCSYMQQKGEQDRILRIDLTADRAARKQCRPYEWLEGNQGTKITLINSPPHTPYQMSFQAAIWSRDLLLEILQPSETAQEAEVNGTQRLRNREDILVLGTLERPLVYQPVYRSHRDVMQLDKIPKGQLQAMVKHGYLKR
jgi:hypothetical protein